jgi:hypothetical protein
VADLHSLEGENRAGCAHCVYWSDRHENREGQDTGKYFWREEMLPIVEHFISELYKGDEEFVHHDAIVQAMLADKATRDYCEDVSRAMRTRGTE